MDAVILQRADHFEAGAVAHVSEARIAMPAEVALQNPAVFSAIENRAPGFELMNPRRSFLGVQLRHAAIVQILPAAHGVGEMNRQLSRSSTFPMAAAMPPSAMTVCALPKSDLVITAVFAPAPEASIARAILRRPRRSPAHRIREPETPP